MLLDFWEGERRNKVSDSNFSNLTLLNWNLQNTSKNRAIKQLNWIRELGPELLILTELKPSEGTNYMKGMLEKVGYNLFYTIPEGDYYTIVGSKIPATEYNLSLSFLPHRAKGIEINKKGRRVILIGMYVPSRGPAERRNEDKKRFQNKIEKVLEELQASDINRNLIIGGDLNVIEPDHKPLYSIYGNWEFRFYRKFIDVGLIDAFKKLNERQDYSWFGRKNNGYRFDHIFTSKQLEDKISECFYDHNVRKRGLSDHSAMILKTQLF